MFQVRTLVTAGALTGGFGSEVSMVSNIWMRLARSSDSKIFYQIHGYFN
jgi:hypothetical protein